MSKMTCVEAIFDELTGKISAGLDHECLDDLMAGCFALACGESSEPDIVAWIAARDKERSEFQICLDICDYFRRFHGAAKPSAVIARAIAAGKEAL